LGSGRQEEGKCRSPPLAAWTHAAKRRPKEKKEKKETP
jgi:hypothetical protein